MPSATLTATDGQAGRTVALLGLRVSVVTPAQMAGRNSPGVHCLTSLKEQ
jgi:hypothetical protein